MPKHPRPRKPLSLTFEVDPKDGTYKVAGNGTKKSGSGDLLKSVFGAAGLAAPELLPAELGAVVAKKGLEIAKRDILPGFGASGLSSEHWAGRPAYINWHKNSRGKPDYSRPPRFTVPNGLVVVAGAGLIGAYAMERLAIEVSNWWSGSILNIGADITKFESSVLSLMGIKVPNGVRHPRAPLSFPTWILSHVPDQGSIQMGRGQVLSFVGPPPGYTAPSSDTILANKIVSSGQQAGQQLAGTIYRDAQGVYQQIGDAAQGAWKAVTNTL